jgi:hypothetical protein
LDLLLVGSEEAGAADRFARSAGCRGRCGVVWVRRRRLQERPLCYRALVRVELLPLLWVLDFCLEVGCGAAVGADEDGVGVGGEEGADTFVVPGVGARSDEETLAWLEIVRMRNLPSVWARMLTAMLLRHIEQSCEYEPAALAAVPAVIFLNLLWVAILAPC